MKRRSRARTTTGWGLAVAAALCALVTCAPGAQALVTSTRAASAVPSAGGLIDADVRTRSGRLLGFLQGDLKRSGRGLLTFKPSRGARLSAEVVFARGRPARGGKVAVSGRGGPLAVNVRIGPEGRLRGTGRLGRLRLRLSGVGRQPLAGIERGMRMLVVGHPRGEGYTALKRLFTPVAYRPRDTRAAFLRDRRGFRRFGALVLGRGVTLSPGAADELLRTFYGEGRWVIVARPGRQALQMLEELDPAVRNRRSPAIAVGAFGPRGNSSQVRTTLAYPVAVRARGLSAAQRRDAARSRSQWFLSQLQRPPAPGSPKLLGADDGSSVDFSPPDNAALIMMRVPYYHEFTLDSEQNSLRSQPCAWDQHNWNAWCSDTWRWQNVLSGLAGGKVPDACNMFMNDGFEIMDAQTVRRVSNSLNGDGAYTVHWGEFNPGFVQSRAWGDQCPDRAPQVGSIQGNDYYYAIYEPTLRSHTIVVVSDPTISATVEKDARLVHEGNNGSGRIWTLNECPAGDCTYRWDGHFFPEDAFFLGAYTDTVTLSGPHVDGNCPSEQPVCSLIYSGSQSVPNNQIEFSDQNSEVSETASISVGVFGDAGTGSYGRSQTVSAGVTIRVPDWKVIPTFPKHGASYDWRTNTPLSWDTITKGGYGVPFHQLNDLNRSGFVPASLTVWTGDATWGKINVDVTREVKLVDHWSAYDGNVDQQEGFEVTTLTYNDGPDNLTPNTPSPVGPGINLCDEKVRAPAFIDECKKAYPPPSGGG